MIDQTAGNGDAAQRAIAHHATEVSGRYVVVMPDGTDAGTVLSEVAGMSAVASSRDFSAQAVDMSQVGGAQAMWFDELGMGVVSADPEQVGALLAAVGNASAPVEAVVPELVYHVLPGPEFVAGYRAGVQDLSEHLLSQDVEQPAGPLFEDNAEATWGLQAVGWASDVPAASGVRVAVLDTGMDLEHPDFSGRQITAKSFVEGESAQDGHGHGTHCIGSACGAVSQDGRRYGVASDAEIYAGKVLGDEGSGSDTGILAGINWAVANECAVISMSLGADVREQHPPYVVAGRRALERGSLIIAAAGNNADRPGDPGFVGTPANSPAIMAVAAVDSRLAIARFSARSLPGSGGQVDLAGPGVEVFSAWPMPTRYNTISGTSMATPHAAGVAAVWAGVTGRRGLELWATLDKQARRLELPSVDVGAGLVQVRA